MEVGLLLTGDKLTLRELADLGKQAEDAGFHSVWMAEHFRDAFTPLALIAANTNRVIIGSDVALAFGRGPVLTEITAAGLDELSGGRMILGLGIGPPTIIENWHGEKFERPIARMREYAELVRLMWTAHSGKTVSYDGVIFKVNGYLRWMRPYRESIPIYFGAVNPQMIRLAGAMADGAIAMACSSVKYHRDVFRPNVVEGAKKAGRDPKRVVTCDNTVCSVDKDGREARRRARPQVSFYCRFDYHDVVTDQHGFQRDVAAIREAWARNDIDAAIDAVTDDMIDTLSLTGTPDEVRCKLRDYETVVDHPLFYSPSFLLEPDEIRHNQRMILDTFAQ